MKTVSVNQTLEDLNSYINVLISEGGHANSMYNSITPLQDGAAGVPQNTAISITLYERAIEKANHVNSMFSLVELLRNRGERVPPYNRILKEQ